MSETGMRNGYTKKQLFDALKIPIYMTEYGDAIKDLDLTEDGRMVKITNRDGKQMLITVWGYEGINMIARIAEMLPAVMKRC